MSKATAPQTLARRGISAVSDDLPAGVGVGNFARDFVLIFREELMRRFAEQPVPVQEPRRSPR